MIDGFSKDIIIPLLRCPSALILDNTFLINKNVTNSIYSLISFAKPLIFFSVESLTQNEILLKSFKTFLIISYLLIAIFLLVSERKDLFYFYRIVFLSVISQTALDSSLKLIDKFSVGKLNLSILQHILFIASLFYLSIKLARSLLDSFIDDGIKIIIYFSISLYAVSYSTIYMQYENDKQYLLTLKSSSFFILTFGHVLKEYTKNRERINGYMQLVLHSFLMDNGVCEIVSTWWTKYASNVFVLYWIITSATEIILKNNLNDSLVEIISAPTLCLQISFITILMKLFQGFMNINTIILNFFIKIKCDQIAVNEQIFQKLENIFSKSRIFVSWYFFIIMSSLSCKKLQKDSSLTSVDFHLLVSSFFAPTLDFLSERFSHKILSLYTKLPISPNIYDYLRQVTKNYIHFIFYMIGVFIMLPCYLSMSLFNIKDWEKDQFELRYLANTNLALLMNVLKRSVIFIIPLIFTNPSGSELAPRTCTKGLIFDAHSLGENKAGLIFTFSMISLAIEINFYCLLFFSYSHFDFLMVRNKNSNDLTDFLFLFLFAYKIWWGIEMILENWRAYQKIKNRLDFLSRPNPSDLGTLFMESEKMSHHERCCVCLSDWNILEGIDGIKKTPCNHYFHAQCIRRWLYIKGSCPLCVAPIGWPDINEDGRNNFYSIYERSTIDTQFNNETTEDINNELQNGENTRDNSEILENENLQNYEGGDVFLEDPYESETSTSSIYDDESIHISVYNNHGSDLFAEYDDNFDSYYYHDQDEGY